ncbi:MAG: beta strand repeat-containing protein [Pirellulales bacterium]
MCRLLQVVVLGTGLGTTVANAASQTWTGGGGDGLWSSATNWSGTAPPSPTGDGLLFGGVTAVTSTNNIVTSATSVAFANTGTAGQTAGFTLTGSGFTLAGSIITTAATSGTLTDIIATNLTLSGQRALTTNANHYLTLSGTIDQSGGSWAFNKAGTGIATLTGLNTFSGTVNINAGTLVVGSLGSTTQPGALGQGALLKIGNAGADGILTHTGTSEATDKQLQIGGGGGTQLGSATINANGSGGISFTNAAFNIADTGTAARTLTLGGTSAVTNSILGTIIDNTSQGTVGITKTGAGSWLLAGANTYSGTTSITAGSLLLGAPSVGSVGSITSSPLGRGPLVLGGGAIAGSDSATARTILNPVSLTVDSTVGSGTNNASITIAAAFTNNGGNSTLTNSLTGGTLTLAGPVYLSNNATGRVFTIGGVGSTSVTGTIADSAAGGGAGTLTKNSSGTLTLAAANTYTGATYLNAGTLVVATIGSSSAAGGTGTGPLVRIGAFGTSGTLRTTGTGETTDKLFQIGSGTSVAHTGGGIIESNGTGGLTFTSATFNSPQAGATIARTLTLGGSSAALNTIKGVIQDNVVGGTAAVALLKTGPSTWALAGTNTYSGTTTVAEGTLLINAQNAGVGPVTVASLATLGGTGTIAGPTVIAGYHSPGASSPGLQTFGGGLDYGASAALRWELSANTAASADRGTLFDGVTLTSGTLAIAPSVTAQLIFNAPLADGTPSTVVWTDPFWASSHSWAAIETLSPATWDGASFGTVSVGVDSLGTALSTSRPGATFSISQNSGTMEILYIVPEPGALGLLAIGGVLLARARLIRTRSHRFVL